MTEDAQGLWRGQVREDGNIDIERLETLVRTDRTRARRRRWFLALAAVLGASLNTWLCLSAPMALLRIGEGLMAIGFVLMFALGWRRLSRPPPDSSDACVAFLRRRLLLRRNAARGGWLLPGAPLLPGMGFSIVGLAIASGSRWWQLAPIAALVAVWLVAAVAIQAWEAARIDAEIAQLDELSRG